MAPILFPGMFDSVIINQFYGTFDWCYTDSPPQRKLKIASAALRLVNGQSTKCVASYPF